ncbi:MAG TPA: hypothetical protein ENO21_04125 [Firmicutes bacterium]|nr:hypothetical protein [Bacillota bacterium]
MAITQADGEYTMALRVTDTVGSQDIFEFPDPVTISGASSSQGDWWCFGRDPHNTSDSLAVGPGAYSLKWSYFNGSLLPSTLNSCVYGNNGVIYIPSALGYLFAVRPDGSLKWQSAYLGGTVYSTPAIAEDGSIYVVNNLSHLYKVDSLNGTATLVNSTPTNGYCGSPALGPDGTIYWGDGNGYLNAVNPDGSSKWRYYMGGFADYSTPAVRATDGILTVYIINTGQARLYRIDDLGQGSPYFRYTTADSLGQQYGSPVCDSGNKVYCGNYGQGRIYVFTDTGAGFSSYYCQIEGTSHYRPYYGTVAIRESAIETEVYWVGYGGYLCKCIDSGSAIYMQWRTASLGGYYHYITPCIDAVGQIFVAGDSNRIHCFDSSGEVIWRSVLLPSDLLTCSLANDGTLYTVDESRHLHAIGGP